MTGLTRATYGKTAADPILKRGRRPESLRLSSTLLITLAGKLDQTFYRQLN